MVTLKGETNLLSFHIDQGFIFRLSVQNPILLIYSPVSALQQPDVPRLSLLTPSHSPELDKQKKMDRYTSMM